MQHMRSLVMLTSIAVCISPHCALSATRSILSDNKGTVAMLAGSSLGTAISTYFLIKAIKEKNAALKKSAAYKKAYRKALCAGFFTTLFGAAGLIAGTRLYNKYTIPQQSPELELKLQKLHTEIYQLRSENAQKTGLPIDEKDESFLSVLLKHADHNDWETVNAYLEELSLEDQKEAITGTSAQGLIHLAAHQNNTQEIYHLYKYLEICNRFSERAYRRHIMQSSVAAKRSVMEIAIGHAQEGDSTLLRYMLEHKKHFDLDLADKIFGGDYCGLTLSDLVRNDNPNEEVLTLLIEHGADPDQTEFKFFGTTESRATESIRQKAKRLGWEKVTALFERLKPEAPTQPDRTALPG